MVFIIIGILILFFILLLLLWVRLSLVYDLEGADVTVKFLFMKFKIIRKEKKKIKKGDFKIKKFRKRQKKILAKYRKKSIKRNKKEEGKKSTENHKKGPKKRNHKDLIKKIINFSGVILKKFSRYLNIDCLRLIIGVGGNDAADIAVNYGVAVQSVQYTATLLNKITNINEKEGAEISVYPDFAEGKWSADICIIMRLRIIHILKLGIIALKQYLKYKTIRKKTGINETPAEKKVA